MNNLPDEERQQILNQRDEGQVLEIVRDFKRNRNYLFLFLFFQMLYDIIYNVWSIRDRDQNYLEMKRFYGMLSLHQIECFYWFITACKIISIIFSHPEFLNWAKQFIGAIENLIVLAELVFCFVYYSVGYFSLYKKSVKLLDMFNVLCIVGLLSQMIQAYVQR